MGNLRNRLTKEEWDKLEDSLVGEKKNYERFPVSDEQIEDSIVKSVREDLKERSEEGVKKYNTTLDRTDLKLKDWLQHAYEETLDKALYLKRAIKEIK